jgi:hypothetical protein
MNVSSYRQLPRELEFEVFDFLPIEEQQRLVNLFKCSQAKIDTKIAARKKNRVQNKIILMNLSGSNIDFYR